MPIQHAAREMRDMYANEIAAALHAGQQPSRFQLESWAKYDAAATAEQPATVFQRVIES